MTTEDAILNNLDLVLQRIEASIDRLEGIRPAGSVQRVQSQPKLPAPAQSSPAAVGRVTSSGSLNVSCHPNFFF